MNSQSNPDPFSRSQIIHTQRSEFKRRNIKIDSKVRTPTSYIKLKMKAFEVHEAKRNRNYNIYTSKNMRLNESN